MAGRIFAIILLVSAVWSFCSWMMHIGASPSPRFWLITGLGFAILLSPLMVHFATEYPNRKSRTMWLVLSWYGIALIFEVANLLGKFIERVDLIPASGGVVDIEFGPMMTSIGWPFMALTIFVMAALFVHAFRSTNSSDDRLLLRYPIIGTAFLFGGGLLNIFPTFTGYPIDFLANISFALLIAYAINKHRLFNAKIMLRRNLALIVLFLIVSGLFILTIRLIEGTIRESSNFDLWLMTIPIAAILLFLLQSLRGKLQAKIDRLFWGKRYDYRKTLLEFSRQIGANLQLDVLAKDLLKMLSDSLDCDKASLFLRSTAGNSFELKYTIGFENKKLLRGIRILSNDPFVIWAQKSAYPLSRAEIGLMSESSNSLIGDTHWMEILSCELVCPLIIRNNVIGFIVLGQRRSGDDHSDEDVFLFSTISNHVAVAIDNARLYAESKKMYVDLKQTQEKLIRSERMHALGQLASGVAHDFNNILTVILGRAQITLRQIEDEKTIRNLQIIKQTALDAAETVRRLQDFARVRSEQTFDIIDLNEIVKETIEMIKPLLDEQHENLNAAIKLDVHLSETGPIQGNAGELREAFMNILVNAIDAMPNGGQLTIGSKQENGYVVLSFSDTGVGMTKEVRRQVFDPFFTTKGKEGLGMGLSLVYSTIKRHRGQIQVSSKPKMGSTFNIRIPITHEIKKKTMEAGAQQNNNEDKTANILVVDDDKLCCDVIYEILIEDGHNVDIATNGREGISLANHKSYNVVLADFGLPDISGVELAAHIKRCDSETQVILVTGWGFELNPRELKDKGIDMLIPKPFRSEDILASVRQLLDNRSTRIKIDDVKRE